MSVYLRASRGAQAGALAAAVVEASFFILDVVRLRPLATPFVLSGASSFPGDFVLDLTSMSGILAALWATYQVLMLTLAHFVAFVVVGVVASLAFDWTRPGDASRFAVVTMICTGAFFGTVAGSSSIIILESIGVAPVLGMSLLGALVLSSVLRLVSMPETEKGSTQRP